MGSAHSTRSNALRLAIRNLQGRCGATTGGAEGVAESEKEARTAEWRNYEASWSAKAKENMIRGLARAFKNLGIPIDPDADLEVVARMLVEKVPDPRKGKTFNIDAKNQEKVCREVAKALNQQFTPGVTKAVDQFIDPTLSAENICAAVGAWAHSFASGVNTEYLAVVANARNAMRNIDVAKAILDKAHAEYAAVDPDDADRGAKLMQAEELYGRATKVLDLQLALLKNILHIDLPDAAKSLELALQEYAETAPLIAQIQKKNGQFGDALARSLSMLGSAAAVAERVHAALKKVGMKTRDYLASKDLAELRAALREYESKLPPQKLPQHINAARILVALFDEVQADAKTREALASMETAGGAEGVEGGAGAEGVEGGADDDMGEPGSVKRVISTVKNNRELIARAFASRITELYGELLTAIRAVAPELGKQIPLSEKTDDLRNAIARLRDMRGGASPTATERIELQLIGGHTEAAAREIKETFVNSLRLVETTCTAVAADEKSRGAAPLLERVRRAISSIIETIDRFSDAYMRRVGGAEGGAEGGADMPIIDDIPRGAVSLNDAVGEFLYYYYVAGVRANLAVTSKDLAEYGAKYDELMGAAVGYRIKTLQERAKAAKARLDKGVQGGPVLRPEVVDDAKKWIDDDYKVRAQLYRAIEAIDLYLKAFTASAATDPEALRDIKKAIDGTQIIARWFDDETGENVWKAFESMNMYDTRAGAKADSVVDAQGHQRNPIPPPAHNYADIDKPITQMGREHYYMKLVQKSFGDDGTPGHPLAGVSFITPAGADNSRANMAMKYVKTAYDHFQGLKNLVNAFARIGDTFGGRSLRQQIFMSPTQIYKALVDFLKHSALTCHTQPDAGDSTYLNPRLTSVARGSIMTAGGNVVNAAELFFSVVSESGERDHAHPYGSFVGYSTTEYGYFAAAIKAMSAKVLTALGLYDMLTSKLPYHQLTPTRMIVGGGVDNPDIIPECAELYFRIPRLAEFYRGILRWDGMSPGVGHPDAVRRVAMLPDLEGTFAGIIRLVFLKALTPELGDYTEMEMQEIVREVNRIHGTYPDSRTALTAFVAEVNKRFGLIEKRDMAEYWKMVQEPTATTLAINPTNLSILPDEADPTIERRAPHERWGLGEYDPKTLGAKPRSELDSRATKEGDRLRDMLRDFRSKIEGAIGRDDLRNKAGKVVYGPFIRQAEKDIRAATTYATKFDVAVRLIQGNNLSGADNHKTIMYHETVVFGLNTLSIICSILEDFRANRDRFDPVPIENAFMDAIYSGMFMRDYPANQADYSWGTIFGAAPPLIPVSADMIAKYLPYIDGERNLSHRTNVERACTTTNVNQRMYATYQSIQVVVTEWYDNAGIRALTDPGTANHLVNGMFDTTNRNIIRDKFNSQDYQARLVYLLCLSLLGGAGNGGNVGQRLNADEVRPLLDLVGFARGVDPTGGNLAAAGNPLNQLPNDANRIFTSFPAAQANRPPVLTALKRLSAELGGRPIADLKSVPKYAPLLSNVIAAYLESGRRIQEAAGAANEPLANLDIAFPNLEMPSAFTDKPLDNLTAGQQLTIKSFRFLARMHVDYQLMMRHFLDYIFALASNDLVEVRYLGGTIKLGFTKLRSVVEDIMRDVKTFHEQLRPYIPKAVAQVYEDKNNPGSIYWLEEHLFDAFFRHDGRSNGESLERDATMYSTAFKHLVRDTGVGVVEAGNPMTDVEMVGTYTNAILPNPDPRDVGDHPQRLMRVETYATTMASLLYYDVTAMTGGFAVAPTEAASSLNVAILYGAASGALTAATLAASAQVAGGDLGAAGNIPPGAAARAQRITAVTAAGGPGASLAAGIAAALVPGAVVGADVVAAAQLLQAEINAQTALDNARGEPKSRTVIEAAYDSPLKSLIGLPYGIAGGLPTAPVRTDRQRGFSVATPTFIPVIRDKTISLDRGLMMLYNQLVSMFLSTMSDPSGNYKIYSGLIQAFANGPAGQSVNNPSTRAFPDVRHGVSNVPGRPAHGEPIGMYGDPKNGTVLFQTLACAIRNIVKDVVDRTAISEHLITTLADVPLYMKETIRANGPIFAKLFDTVAAKCEFLRNVIEKTHINISRMWRTLNNSIAVDDAEMVAAGGGFAPNICIIMDRDLEPMGDLSRPINDTGAEMTRGVAKTYLECLGAIGDALHPFSNQRQFTTTMKPIFISIINAIASGCNTLVTSIDDVLKELGDSPEYFRTGENSIEMYRARTTKTPFAPLSLVANVFTNVVSTTLPAGLISRSAAWGDYSENRRVFPPGGPGTDDFKFAYGTRHILTRSALPDYKQMPTVKQIVASYNSSVVGADRVDEARYLQFAQNIVRLTRYAVTARNLNGLIVPYNLSFNARPIFYTHGAPARNNGALVGESVNNGPVRNTVYALRGGVNAGVAVPPVTVQAVVDVVENTNQTDIIDKFIAPLRSATPEKNRKDEVLLNLIDMNIIPINVHALMRDIPLANIYNYEYTFEQIAASIFGLQATDAALTASDDANANTAKQMFLRLLFKPYSDVSDDKFGSDYYQYGLNAPVARIFRGDADLGMGRPKFLSDQLFNKALLRSVYVSAADRDDEGGPVAGSGRRQAVHEHASQAFRQFRHAMEYLNHLRDTYLGLEDNGHRKLGSVGTYAAYTAIAGVNLDSLKTAFDNAFIVDNTRSEIDAELEKWRRVLTDMINPMDAASMARLRPIVALFNVGGAGAFAAGNLAAPANPANHHLRDVLAVTHGIDANQAARIGNANYGVSIQSVRALLEHAISQINNELSPGRANNLHALSTKHAPYVATNAAMAGGAQLTYMNTTNLNETEVVAISGWTDAERKKLDEMGKLRFDTHFVRSLFFLTNVNRLMRLKLNRELTQSRGVVVGSMPLVSMNTTEYGFDPNSINEINESRARDGQRRFSADDEIDA